MATKYECFTVSYSDPGSFDMYLAGALDAGFVLLSPIQIVRTGERVFSDCETKYDYEYTATMHRKVKVEDKVPFKIKSSTPIGGIARADGSHVQVSLSETDQGAFIHMMEYYDNFQSKQQEIMITAEMAKHLGEFLILASEQASDN